MTFHLIRAIDDAHSRDVQSGLVPFNETIVRGIRAMYDEWWEREGQRLPEDADESKFYRRVLGSIGVEDVIASAKQIAAGEVEPLEERPCPRCGLLTFLPLCAICDSNEKDAW